MTPRPIHHSPSYTQDRPQVTLNRGDVFRARGGPLYVTGDGQQIDMGCPGIYRFCRLSRQGARVWIEAAPIGGGALEHVYVGKRRRSRTVDGLVLVPHRVSRLRAVTVDKVTGKARRKARRAQRSQAEAVS